MTPFDQVFYPTLGLGCALGTFLVWTATGRGLIGQLLLLLLAFAVGWLSLILGVHLGYGAWQSMPDPPEVAFADGDELTMSVMFGWAPTGAGCVFVWALCHLVRSLGEIARRRAAPQA